jgi:hypothetical protein
LKFGMVTKAEIPEHLRNTLNQHRADQRNRDRPRRGGVRDACGPAPSSVALWVVCVAIALNGMNFRSPPV